MARTTKYNPQMVRKIKRLAAEPVTPYNTTKTLLPPRILGRVKMKPQTTTDQERLIKELLDLVCSLAPDDVEILAFRGSYQDTLTDGGLADLVNGYNHERKLIHEIQ